MKPSRAALLPALAVLAGLSTPAAAQTAQPSPEAAKALEAQIRTWLVASSANALPVPARPVEMTAAGDHYAARVPLNGLGKVQPPDAALTATVKPLGGTRWAVDNQAFPSDFSVTTTETVPDAPDEKNPSPDGKHTESVTYHLKLGQQTSTGVLDTSYATPATSNGTITSFDMDKTGGAGPSHSHFDSLITQSSVSPDARQHLDMTVDGTGQGYASQTTLPDGSTASLTASRLRFTTAITSFDPNRAVSLIGLAAQMAKADKAAPHDDAVPMTTAQKAQARALLTAATGLLTGGRLDQSAEGVHYDFGGHQGSIAKVDVALNGDAPEDLLTASMAMTIDGLAIDELPPALAAYLPTHFTVRPTLSNLSVKDLTKLAMDATDPAGQPPPEPDMVALFQHGGIAIGLDELALDVAGTQFTGTGKFNLAGPQTVTGQAEVRAQGLDSLITKAQNDPNLAQGVPVLIFLKGIAKTSGDQALWQITVAPRSVLVNGVDLMKMAGAMK